MSVKPILLIGGSNTDVIVRSKGFPKPGETISGGVFSMSGGGKAANQALSIHRLGGKVLLYAKVGDDIFGRNTLSKFENEGFDISQIQVLHNIPSGVALILVNENAENMISVASGSNHCFGVEDIPKITPLISQSALLVLQLEIPFDFVVKCAELAHELKVPVLLDPSPAITLLPSVLQHVTYLKPNEHEAEVVSGVKVTDVPSAVAAARVLLEMGVQRAVLITLGAEGVVCVERGKEDTPVHVRPPPSFGRARKVIDTTGAGDAFNGAFALKITEDGGSGIAQALEYACCVGSLSTTKMGAQDSLPTAAEVEAVLRENGGSGSCQGEEK